MDASKNSGFIFKVNKIDPIKISKQKIDAGAKVENWVLAVHCGRGMVQKVVVLPKQLLKVFCKMCKISQENTCVRVSF